MICELCNGVLAANEAYETDNKELVCRRCYLESQDQQEYDAYFDDIDTEDLYE